MSYTALTSEYLYMNKIQGKLALPWETYFIFWCVRCALQACDFSKALFNLNTCFIIAFWQILYTIISHKTLKCHDVYSGKIVHDNTVFVYSVKGR